MLADPRSAVCTQCSTAKFSVSIGMVIQKFANWARENIARVEKPIRINRQSVRPHHAVPWISDVHCAVCRLCNRGIYIILMGIPSELCCSVAVGRVRKRVCASVLRPSANELKQSILYNIKWLRPTVHKPSKRYPIFCAIVLHSFHLIRVHATSI